MGRQIMSAEARMEQAIANGYSPGAHKADDSIRKRIHYDKKTLRDQNKILNRYEIWTEQQKTLDGTRLQPPRSGVPAPALFVIKDFFRYFVATSKGLLDPERPTIDSVVCAAEWFFAGFARVTGNPVNPEDRSDVYSWIRRPLAEEGKVSYKKKDKHGSSTTEHSKLSRDDTQYLIALAIADGALLHIKSVQDLWQFQIPAGSDELPLLWEDSKKNLPVLRKADMTHGVTDEALSAEKFTAILKSVWHQAGYFKDVTVHCIRRALGKAVNARYTPVERAQHITQPDQRTYGRDYMANTSSVDGRSAFYNEPAQHDHVEYFQSFAGFREVGLPTTLPTEREMALQQHKEYRDLRSQISQLKQESDSSSIVRALQRQSNQYLEKARKHALKEYINEWVDQRRRAKQQNKGSIDPIGSGTTDLEESLELIMPERRRLAITMTSERDVSTEERRNAVQDLYTLATRDCTVLYRPGEEPIGGRCPAKDCGIELERYLKNDERLPLTVIILTMAASKKSHVVYTSTYANIPRWQFDTVGQRQS
ncbi:MAG: hypothetical protein Q9213_001791 [Squamulea squamosa]